jgi:hypothetical protein
VRLLLLCLLLRNVKGLLLLCGVEAKERDPLGPAAAAAVAVGLAAAACLAAGAWRRVL